MRLFFGLTLLNILACTGGSTPTTPVPSATPTSPPAETPVTSPAPPPLPALSLLGVDEPRPSDCMLVTLDFGPQTSPIRIERAHLGGGCPTELQLAVHPDGKRMIVGGGAAFHQVDLRSGQSTPLPRLPDNGRVSWCGEVACAAWGIPSTEIVEGDLRSAVMAEGVRYPLDDASSSAVGVGVGRSATLESGQWRATLTAPIYFYEGFHLGDELSTLPVWEQMGPSWRQASREQPTTLGDEADEALAASLNQVLVAAGVVADSDTSWSVRRSGAYTLYTRSSWFEGEHPSGPALTRVGDAPALLDPAMTYEIGFTLVDRWLLVTPHDGGHSRLYDLSNAQRVWEGVGSWIVSPTLPLAPAVLPPPLAPSEATEVLSPAIVANPPTSTSPPDAGSDNLAQPPTGIARPNGGQRPVHRPRPTRPPRKPREPAER